MFVQSTLVCADAKIESNRAPLFDPPDQLHNNELRYPRRDHEASIYALCFLLCLYSLDQEVCKKHFEVIIILEVHVYTHSKIALVKTSRQKRDKKSCGQFLKTELNYGHASRAKDRLLHGLLYLLYFRHKSCAE